MSTNHIGNMIYCTLTFIASGIRNKDILHQLYKAIVTPHLEQGTGLVPLLLTAVVKAFVLWGEVKQTRLWRMRLWFYWNVHNPNMRCWGVFFCWLEYPKPGMTDSKYGVGIQDWNERTFPHPIWIFGSFQPQSRRRTYTQTEISNFWVLKVDRASTVALGYNNELQS